MTALVPRLRMFAGPNGSGKSTIKEVLPPDRQIRLIFCERPSRPATALTCILWLRNIPTFMLRVFSLV